jgi:hypothetical protein
MTRLIITTIIIVIIASTGLGVMAWNVEKQWQTHVVEHQLDRLGLSHKAHLIK